MSKSLSKKILAALMVGSLATSSFADNLRGLYVGVGGALVDGNEADANGSSPNFRLVNLVGGYKYASWAGAEVRIGTGLSDETFTANINGALTDLDFSLDSYVGVYYRPELSNPEAKLYGLFGFSSLETSSSDDGGSFGRSESGFSYGVGVGFVMNEDLNINFEYLEFINEDETHFSGFSMIFDYRI